MKRIASVVVTAALVVGTRLLAQSPAPKPATPTVETDPIDCWWRTSATSVRIGEPFSFVLTCSVVETDAVKVIPDQSALEPTVVQMQPFEVIGGSHGPDLRAEDRRFFQYEYRLRLIGEDLFGKDVSLPAMKLTYRLQSRVGQGESAQGRDRLYLLPPESIRVLALVPADATAIRDGAAESFTDIDSRVFRSNAMLVGGGILLGLAALVGIQMLVSVAGRYRARAPVTPSLVSDSAILRTVKRELSEIGREREGSGWTPDLAGRALIATRIAASYALHRPVSQTRGETANGNGATHEGALNVRSGWLRRKEIFVAGSVTAENVTRASQLSSMNGHGGGALEDAGRALTDLSNVWYGRDAKLNESALDESLSSSLRLHRQVAGQNTWFAKRLAALKRAATRQGSAA